MVKGSITNTEKESNKKSKEDSKSRSRSRGSRSRSRGTRIRSRGTRIRNRSPKDEFYFSIPDEYSHRQIKNVDLDIENIMLMCGINQGDRSSLHEGLKSYSCGIFDEESIDVYKNYCISIYIQNNSDKDDIKGICFIKIFMEREISIDLLCVPPKHKGKGTLLIDKIKKMADFANCKIVLSAIPGGVVKFYKKNGFVVKDENAEDDYENEYYALNVQMEYVPPHFAEAFR